VSSTLIFLAVGPLVTSDAARDAELDVSLLQRLFDRPVYAIHAENPSAYTPSRFRPYTNLVKVFRLFFFGCEPN
jgi:hypothetical protein